MIARIHIARFALITGISLLTVSCSLTDLYEEQSVPIERFELLSATQQSVSFELFGTWRNTCGSVAHFNETKSGNTYTVEMIGKQKQNATCGQAFSEISDTWSVDPDGAQTLTLRFRAEASSTIDTTIVVPGNAQNF